MDYESLGRYTEAVEHAEDYATALHNAFLKLGRLSLCINMGSGAIGCEYDFDKIHAAVETAEQAYMKMLAAVSVANHEAAICGKPAVKLYKAGN